jgi:hypothetical protein
VYFGGASAQIIDESTGRPLRDVVVVSTWTLHLSISGGEAGYAEVQETRTDANGVFRLSAWGPRVRLRGSIYPIEPEVRAIRSGYLPLEVLGVGTTLGKSPVLRMQPASGEEYGRAFASFLERVPMYFLMTPFECAWLKTPQMMEFLRAEALGTESQTFYDSVAGMKSPDCGR